MSVELNKDISVIFTTLGYRKAGTEVATAVGSVYEAYKKFRERDGDTKPTARYFDHWIPSQQDRIVLHKIFQHGEARIKEAAKAKSKPRLEQMVYGTT